MQYRKLGNGPLTVSEISYGTWLTVGGKVEREQAIRCVHTALDLGINLFDTANMYGAGESERVLGEALRNSGRTRDQYLIATKVFNPVGDEPDKGLSATQIAKQLDRSLERLGVDYIDLYQCHRYDKETPLEETLEALDLAVKSGKVRSIGLSEWPVDKIIAAAQLTAAHQFTPMTSSQPQYSMLWRKPEAAVFAACHEHGLGNIVYSPLAQGVLTGKYQRRASSSPGQPRRQSRGESNHGKPRPPLSQRLPSRASRPTASHRRQSGPHHDAVSACLDPAPAGGLLSNRRRLQSRPTPSQRSRQRHPAEDRQRHSIRSMPRCCRWWYFRPDMLAPVKLYLSH